MWQPCKHIKFLVVCVLVSGAAPVFAQKGIEPLGVRLDLPALGQARDRLDEIRQRQSREAKDDTQRRELAELADLEKRYWKLWKENLNADLGDTNARPTRPSAAGLRELMSVGRELYTRYDERLQHMEHRLDQAGSDPDNTAELGLRTLRAQRDMFNWTISRTPQPPPARWLAESEISRLSPQVQQRYRALKQEIGGPLPLPAPDSIVVAGQRHTKQEIFDSVRGKNRAEIQKLFDMMSQQMQQALNIPSPPPGADPRALERVAEMTLAVNAEMVKPIRFWLAALAEVLIDRREPKEIDEDIDAVLKATQQWLKDTEALVK